MTHKSAIRRWLRNQDKELGSPLRRLEWRKALWKIDDLEDCGLDAGLFTPVNSMLGDGDGDKDCSSAPPTENASSDTTSDLARRLAASRINPKRLDFFDLPAELRTLVYEYYCSCIPSQHMPLRTPIGDKRKRYGRNVGSLIPQLIYHQVRNEFLVAWADVGTIDLPCQRFRRSHLWRHETTQLIERKRWQNLYVLIRHWLDEVPLDLRDRFQRLRVTYTTRDYFSYPEAESADTVIRAEGNGIAGLMERLVDVHPRLCVDLRVYATKWCYTHSRREFGRPVGFTFQQRNPVDVRMTGGYEWVCLKSGWCSV